MAAKTTGASDAVPDEFEPFCHWEKDEGHETLVVHIPEFKKEQLRVQISNQGVLMITGERQVNATKRSGFRKEINVPADCNSNEIHAKFSNGLLSIIMPKMIKKEDETPKRETKQEEKESEKPPVSNNQTGNNSENKEETSQENAAAALLSAERPPYRQGMRLYRPPLMQNLSKKAKTINAGAVVAVVVAIGVYVAYKYWYN